MISFIVIGRNEEKNLKKCFKSIYEAISFNALKQYELIYVDSKSTDNSIELAEAFEEIRIFKITGSYNAAIARNIGALEAKGDVLYFIDGDMEICKEFLEEVLDERENLKYDIVSGMITDLENGVKKMQRHVEPKGKPLDGGIFLIKKFIWNTANGMRTKFINGEDGDLGLRLAEKGFSFTRLNKTITLHNTVNYFDKSRIWEMLFNKSVFYCRCVLYRDHLASKYLYTRIWSDDKTFILLTFILLNCFFVPLKVFCIELLVYLILVFIRSFKQKKYVSVMEFFVYFIVFDLLNIIFLFTFFPRSNRCEYIKVQNNKT